IAQFGLVANHHLVPAHLGRRGLYYSRIFRFRGSTQSLLRRRILRPIEGDATFDFVDATKRSRVQPPLLCENPWDPPVQMGWIRNLFRGREIRYCASQLTRPRFGRAGSSVPSNFLLPWLTPENSACFCGSTGILTRRSNS